MPMHPKLRKVRTGEPFGEIGESTDTYKLTFADFIKDLGKALGVVILMFLGLAVLAICDMTQSACESNRQVIRQKLPLSFECPFWGSSDLKLWARLAREVPERADVIKIVDSKTCYVRIEGHKFLMRVNGSTNRPLTNFTKVG